MAQGVEMLATSEDVSVMSALVGLMSADDIEHGLELARISGEFAAVSRIIDLMQMPVLSAFLAARGERLQEMSVEQIRLAGSTRSLARAMAATGQKIAGMGENEMAEGVARVAFAEGMAQRSAVLAEAGEELAVKGMQEMEQAEDIAYAARDIAAEGAAEVAVGSAALGSAATAADFAGELEEKAR
jgi:hypothetical protein